MCFLLSDQLDAVGWRAVGAYLPGLCDVRFCGGFSLWEEFEDLRDD
jgi:hypothetical protein